MNNVQAVLKALVVIVLMAFAAYFYPYLNPEEIGAFIKSHSVAAPAIFIFICAVRPVLFVIPTMGLTIVAGVAFGALWGTIYVALGGAISTVVGYFFAKWLGRDAVKKLAGVNRYMKYFDEWSRRYGKDSILLMRAFNLPWDLVSYWAGLTGISFRVFYTASMILLLPISFIYTYFGSKVYQPMSAGFLLSLSVIILLTAAPYLIRMIQKKVT